MFEEVEPSLRRWNTQGAWCWPTEDPAYSYWSERPAVYDEALTVTAIADGDGQAGGLGTSKITCRPGETDDTPASFSNWSERSDSTTKDADHTIAGPGVCIYSTYGRCGQTNQYATLSGTSMATPHLAGTAALYKFKNSSATPDQVISALRNDAQAYDITNAYGFQRDPNSSPASGWTSGTTTYYGYLALTRTYRSGVTAPAQPPTDTTAPTVSSTSPKDKATGVRRGSSVTATFSEAMDPTTLKTSTVTLVPSGETQPVSATVSYDATTNTVYTETVIDAGGRQAIYGHGD